MQRESGFLNVVESEQEDLKSEAVDIGTTAEFIFSDLQQLARSIETMDVLSPKIEQFFSEVNERFLLIDDLLEPLLKPNGGVKTRAEHLDALLDAKANLEYLQKLRNNLVSEIEAAGFKVIENHVVAVGAKQQSESLNSPTESSILEKNLAATIQLDEATEKLKAFTEGAAKDNVQPEYLRALRAVEAQESLAKALKSQTTRSTSTVPLTGALRMQELQANVDKFASEVAAFDVQLQELMATFGNENPQPQSTSNLEAGTAPSPELLVPSSPEQQAEAAELSKHIEDNLETISAFAKMLGESAAVNVLLRQAEDSLVRIKELRETLLSSNALSQASFYDKQLSALHAEQNQLNVIKRELLGLVKSSPAGIESSEAVAPVSATQVQEEVPAAATVPENTAEAAKSDAVETRSPETEKASTEVHSEEETKRLFAPYSANLDEAFYKDDGTKKDFNHLAKDLKSLLRAHGYSAEQEAAVFSTVFRPFRKKIKELKSELDKAKDGEHAPIIEQRDARYKEYLLSVAKLLNLPPNQTITEKNLDVDKLPKLDEALDEVPGTVTLLKQLRAFQKVMEYLGKGDSVELTAANNIKEKIVTANTYEPDLNERQRKIEMYLKKLQEKLPLMVAVKVHNDQGIVEEGWQIKELSGEDSVIVIKDGVEKVVTLAELKQAHDGVLPEPAPTPEQPTPQDQPASTPENNGERSIDEEISHFRSIVGRFGAAAAAIPEVKRAREIFKLIDALSLPGSEDKQYLKTVLRNELRQLGDTPVFKADLAGVTPVDQPGKQKLYRKERTEALAARKNFKVVEKAYNDQMKQFIADQSKFDRVKDGVRTLFGRKTTLPPELQALQNEYQEKRQSYVSEFGEALRVRGTLDGNREFSMASDSAKMAFARKFILKPRSEQLAYEASLAMEREKASRVAKVMGVMKKHKGTTRVIGLTIAVGLGAFSGGSIGAGLGAARFATSLVVGAAVGGGVYQRMSNRVEKATENKKLATEALTTNFTVADLNTLEAELLQAEENEKRASYLRTAATIGAGAGVGFAASATSGLIAESMDNSSARQSGDSTPESTETGKRGNTEAMSGQTSETMVHMKKVAVPIYNQDNKLVSNLVLRDIEIQGTNLREGGGIPGGPALEKPQIDEILNDINLKAKDFLYPKPSMPKAEMEKLLFGYMEKKYGGTDWWQKNGISTIKVGYMGVDETAGQSEVSAVEVAARPSATASSTEETTTPVGTDELRRLPGDELPPKPSVPADKEPIPLSDNQSGALPKEEFITERATPTQVSLSTGEAAAENFVHRVKEGETLLAIIKDEYASKLANLSEAEQNRVLFTLDQKLRADATLRDSLQLRSQGNIDLIYPGETLNLARLTSEINQLVAAENVPQQYTRSGALNINGLDAPETKIAITKNNNIPLGGGDSTETAFAVSPEIQDKMAAMFTDVPTHKLALDGVQILNPDGSHTSAFKEIINNYGKYEEYSKLLNKEVNAFEDSHYDVFNVLLQKFTSPYEQMFKNMTLADVAEFKKAYPNADAVRQFTLEARAETNAQVDMKPELVSAWLKRVGQLEQLYKGEVTPETKVGDLMGRMVAQRFIADRTLQ